MVTYMIVGVIVKRKAIYFDRVGLEMPDLELKILKAHLMCPVFTWNKIPPGIYVFFTIIQLPFLLFEQL